MHVVMISAWSHLRSSIWVGYQSPPIPRFPENTERFVKLSEDVSQIWQELEDAIASGQSRDEIRHIVYCNWTIMNHIVSGIAHMNIIRE